MDSLGMDGQPAAGQKGAEETSFKGKAHTLGETPTQPHSLAQRAQPGSGSVLMPAALLS